MNRIEGMDTLVPGKPDDLFVTCSSFEDRCLGAIKERNGYAARAALLVSFLSKTAKGGGRV